MQELGISMQALCLKCQIYFTYWMYGKIPGTFLKNPSTMKFGNEIMIYTVGPSGSYGPVITH